MTDSMDEDFQTEEELASHYGPEGPVLAAHEWMQRLLRDDLRAAWELTDPNFRLVLAQAFLWANREHPYMAGYDFDEVAANLAALANDHDVWPLFEETQLRELHEAMDDFVALPYGSGSRPRAVGIDLEVVKFLRTKSWEEPMVATGPTFVEGIVMLMRSTPDGWRVAGYGVDSPPQPGWPPTSGHPSV